MTAFEWQSELHFKQTWSSLQLLATLPMTALSPTPQQRMAC